MPQALPFQQAAARADWRDMIHMSPEAAAVIRGVPVCVAEAELRAAACEISRRELLQDTVADFERSQFCKESNTTPLYKLIANKGDRHA